jgi:hypothetical protein
MSTRSMILIEQENGEYLGIYCHSDGYLTHNGAMLIDHYNQREKVKELISHGDLSYLSERINPDSSREHSFDRPQRGVCIYYGRDRGETSTDAINFKLEDLSEDPWIEYTYIFGKDNQWKYFEYNGLANGLKAVKEDLDQIFIDWGFTRPEGVYGWYTKSDIARLKTIEKEKEQEQNIRETNLNIVNK